MRRLLPCGLALVCALQCASPSLQAKDVVKHLLADGFDFPVGKPDATGYYKARGYSPNGHLGEDWNGIGGGDTDLGDPIYAAANGVVVFSDDVQKGWGNCIIVRHAYRGEDGSVKFVDSQYGHLLKRYVKLYDKVVRGQQIAEMGGNRGMYPVHLHFEMRKELRLGMNRSAWPKDNTCYYDPTDFINAHRKLRDSAKAYPIPVNTFLGQDALATDPRLKTLEVDAKDRAEPSEADKQAEAKKTSTLREILGQIRRNKSKEAPPPEEKAK